MRLVPSYHEKFVTKWDYSNQCLELSLRVYLSELLVLLTCGMQVILARSFVRKEFTTFFTHQSPIVVRNFTRGSLWSKRLGHISLVGPSNFWKFYLIRTSFTLGQLVSLVKVFRQYKLEQIFFGVQNVDTVGRCTTSYSLARPAC